MATIYVDGVPYQVREGQNLLHACLSLGFNLPYFCWHPAMHSVGACRQCAVKQFKDEKDTRGRIVMACMTPATDGTRISIDDPEAKAFRASVIEWLMINHPHDCPVCDEGGECHLQDMTLMTGHVYRRYRFKKRTYRNQYMGPFVNHEMNRCIQCYRCVRYYRDYAGGRDLDVFAAHDHVYFGRKEDGVLESEFSGNLVEVCPTGVFTDRTLKRHYTRKWDLQTAPSVCVHCAIGCNIIPGERYGTLRRIRNRYNGQVNGYFLCDRGRYGYEFVNSSLRIREPLTRATRDRAEGAGTEAVPRGDGLPEPGGLASPALSPAMMRLVADDSAFAREQVLRRVAEILAESKGVVGIGSPRASLEGNFALRTLVGPEAFHMGMSGPECRLVSSILEILRSGPAPPPSLEEVRSSDAVLVLGEDVTNTAPVLALALRQSVRQRPVKDAVAMGIPLWNDAAVREVVQQARGPLFVATVAPTRLDEVASECRRAAPDDLARLGFAVAGALSEEAPKVDGLPSGEQALAERIAEALREAERPLVVAGTGCGNEAVLRAAANVAWALRSVGRPAALSFTVPECNSLGLGLMGGGAIDEVFRAVRWGKADTVIVLENDLYRRADAAEVDALLQTARHVIAIDHLANATTDRADVVLPAATFAEGDGTLVNNEGRAQRFYQVFAPVGVVQESWRWLRDVMVTVGRREAESWRDLDDIVSAMIRALPVFEPVAEVAPSADFRLAGQKVARQHQRYSGRTAMHAHIDVSEPAPPEDPDAPFVFSMEGYQGQPPPPLIPRFWAPGWNSVQSLNRFQEEVGGPLRGGDPGRRLLEPSREGPRPFFQDVPPAYKPREGELLVVPLHHIFGSEELSIHSPGVAELAPTPYIALSPRDAEELRLGEGAEMQISLGGLRRRLVARLMPALPGGVAGLPFGLPQLLGITLPAWARVANDE